MSRQLSFSIRQKLIITFVIILLVPSLVISSTTYWKASDYIEEEIMYSAAESVSTANSLITNEIESVGSDLDYFVNELGLETASVEADLASGGTAVKNRLSQYLGLHKEVINIYVGTNQGGMLLGKDEELPADYDPRTRDWYKLAMDSSKAVVTPVYLSADGNTVVSVAKKLRDGKGVLSLDLNLTSISNLASMKVGEEGYILILDNTKNVIVNPKGGLGEAADDTIAAPMFAADEGTFEYGMDGQKYKMKFLTNELTGWKIGGTMNKDEVTQQTAAIRNTSILVVVLSIVGGALLIIFNIRSVLLPIRKLNRATAILGHGDLTEKLDGFNRDEIGELAANFQKMVDSLREMVEGVREMTDNVSASAEQLSAGSEQTTKAIEHVTVAIQDVAAGSEQQMQSVERGATSVNTMVQQVEYVSGNMQLINRTMAGMANSAQEGTRLVEGAEHKIRDVEQTVTELTDITNSLNQRAEQIGGIAAVMAEIAQKTNLLSLNAAIEASRAGEEGRGFAVVASEIRKLAEGSSHSADQIRELITRIQDEMNHAVAAMIDIQHKVTEGREAVDLSGQSFIAISQSVMNAAEAVEAAAATMQEVAGESEAARDAIEQIRMLSEQTAGNTQTISAAAEEQLASVEEISSSSADLSRMAEQLQALVGKFKVYKD